MRRSRHPLAALLCAFALLLGVVGGTGAARCAHAAPRAPDAHACCPSKAAVADDGAHHGGGHDRDEACAGSCCELDALNAVSPFDPATLAPAVLQAGAAPALPFETVVRMPRARARTALARAPPRRPPRAPTPAWLSHRALRM